jgi:hypothetical protein
MPERRFNEDEVAAIFRHATDAQENPDRRLPSGEGLTLTELQDIGRDVGIAPEMVSRAAASLESAGTVTSRRFIGLSAGVGHSVELGRRLSDDEWEQLVVDLRETFGARGTVQEHGSFRQWTNGKLQVLVEPTANGNRVRMSTVNSMALAWMRGGLVTFGVAGVATLVSLFGGGMPLASAAAIAAIAAGEVVLGAVRLPRWSRLRRQQMEEIARRLSETAGS